MNNKIGIITMYYNSMNYGGVLQAYALCRVVKEMGYDVEQICYDPNSKMQKKFRNSPKNIVKSIVNKIHTHRLRLRIESFKIFRERIPHSTKLYTSCNYKSLGSEYDIVISGSDQVWNFDWYNEAYFLDFDCKKKLAYAASLGSNSLNTNQIDYLKCVLKSYEAVSVREKDAVDILEQCFDNVVHVIDPVFLLEKEKWELLMSKRLVEDKYIYCHFIGNDKKSRLAAKKYAKEKGLKVVVLPHPSRLNTEDLLFGDERIYSAAPQDFLSLIRYAECVFTDSFHCCSLSIIFQKQFFAFHRLGKKGMASRIYSLTELCGCESHFCDSDEKLSTTYFLDAEPIDYKKANEAVRDFREESLKFLRKYIS